MCLDYKDFATMMLYGLDLEIFVAFKKVLGTDLKKTFLASWTVLDLPFAAPSKGLV